MEVNMNSNVAALQLLEGKTVDGFFQVLNIDGLKKMSFVQASIKPVSKDDLLEGDVVFGKIMGNYLIFKISRIDEDRVFAQMPNGMSLSTNILKVPGIVTIDSE